MRNFLNKTMTAVALAVALMGGLSLFASPPANAAVCTSGDGRKICGGGADVCCEAGPNYCKIISCSSSGGGTDPYTPPPNG